MPRGRPKKIKSEGQKELDRVEKQFEQYEKDISSLTQDEMNKAPKLEEDTQTKISQKELNKTNATYLKPVKLIMSREKFNEKFRPDYEFQKERVNFIAENKEIEGEVIDMWTKPFPGLPAEEWKIPVNKPVNAPRYVAEQIKGCSYHVLMMNPDAEESNRISSDGMGDYYGKMVVKYQKQRLDAIPVQEKQSIFMGGF